MEPIFKEEIAISDVIRIAQDKKATDINFGSNSRVALRVNGSIEFIEKIGVLSQEKAERLIFSIIRNERDKQKLLECQELDFSCRTDNGITYRCNAFYRRKNISISMRHIPCAPYSMEKIGIPGKIKEMITERQGLILISGPTGSGKTTTMASLVEEINNTRRDHRITLEDPIEYTFENKKCMISQRELHNDTHSFENSLRAAMRQDPDIVVVGEIRDKEKSDAVFSLCATGHLVLSTIHANSAAQVIYRIMQFYPAEQKDAVLFQLADMLLGILNQRLVPNKQGSRSAIFELVVSNIAIKNAIRQGNVAQLEDTITISEKDGMQTLEKSAKELISREIIDWETALPHLNLKFL
jgi:twitching motility protein PilT